MRRSRIAGPALVVLVFVSQPANAVAGAVVSVDHACYRPGDAITENGAGFTPSGAVLENLTLFSGVDQLGSFTRPEITADASGGFTRVVRAPTLARSQDREETALSASTDQAIGAAAPVVVSWRVSRWAVKIRAWADRTVDPSEAMLVDTYGWTAGATLYAHYVAGLLGPTKHSISLPEALQHKTVKLGALTGPCGSLKKRVKQFPLRYAQAGQWSVYFSATHYLDKVKDSWLRFRVRVPRAKATW